MEAKPNSTDVIDVLSDLFILRGVPAYIRSDNGTASNEPQFAKSCCLCHSLATKISTSGEAADDADSASEVWR
jgi:hypothetical protein